MKVLYMCFTDFKQINRGSAVRPYKMYEAFINKGYDVVLINGDARNRRCQFQDHKINKKLHNIDYCYVEPSTYPIHPYDYNILLYLKTLKIPIGVFYRDMYYKFPQLYKKSGLNKVILLTRYKIDWLLYKHISKSIYFPSDSMAKYFSFKSKIALPPAGELIELSEKEIKNNLIYVGGASKDFGTDLLLDAMEIVNKSLKINLTLVCREYDEELFDKYKNSSWLSIKHLSGLELIEEYKNADFAIIPRPITEYNNFAVPVKMFEYLTYEMPIISTNCYETAKFINNHQVGVVVKDNSLDLANSIIALYSKSSTIENFRSRIRQVLATGNLWEHRVDKIESTLLL